MYKLMTQNPSNELPRRPRQTHSHPEPDTPSDYRPLNWNRNFTPPEEANAPTSPPMPPSVPAGFDATVASGPDGSDPYGIGTTEDPRLRRPAEPGETTARSANRKEPSEVMTGRQAIATGLLVLCIVAVVAIAVSVLGGMQDLADNLVLPGPGRYPHTISCADLGPDRL